MGRMAMRNPTIRNLSNLLVLSLVLAPGLAAQQQAAQPQESLLIGPGDLLHVQVLDTLELEEHARVTDAGELPLVSGGSVKVASLTPIQAARVIEDALVQRNIMLHPHVLVTVEQNPNQMVSVLGEVQRPSAYPIETPRSVLDVLALAGGLTSGADRNILIERKGTKEKIPYFVSNKGDVAVDNAVTVNPGDTVLVPKADLVYALGDVGRPGGYAMADISSKLSVLELTSLAGGIPPTGVPGKARLIRKTDQGYVEIPIPLNKMEQGKRSDLPLQAGDILYVPFSYLRNLAVNAAAIVATAGNAAVYRF